MAFPQAKPQREIGNPQKILEEIQIQKQLLLKQGVASTLHSSLPVLGSTVTTGTDGHSLNSAQRSALQTAKQQSTGYFISQDSSFGNLILPVLPRFDVK